MLALGLWHLLLSTNSNAVGVVVQALSATGTQRSTLALDADWTPISWEGLWERRQSASDEARKTSRNQLFKPRKIRVHGNQFSRDLHRRHRSRLAGRSGPPARPGPTTVAQQIRALKADIRNQLLRRAGRTVQPTVAGNRILAPCASMACARACSSNSMALSTSPSWWPRAWVCRCSPTGHGGAPRSDLKRWPLPAPCPVRTVGMLWLRGSARAPLADALVQLLGEAA